MVDINYLAWVAAISTLFGFLAYMMSRMIFIAIKKRIYFWAGAALPVGMYFAMARIEELSLTASIEVLLVSAVFSLAAGYITNRILPSKF